MALCQATKSLYPSIGFSWLLTTGYWLLVILQNVTHQRAGEVAGQAIHRRRFFLEKTGELARDFILLAKAVVGIVVECFAIPTGERNAHIHCDQRARKAPGLRIVSKRRDLRRGHNAAQGRISRVCRVGNVIVGSAGEFVHHGGSQNLLQAITGGAVLKSRNGDAAKVAGQGGALPADVIAAAGQEKYEGRSKKNCERTKDEGRR